MTAKTQLSEPREVPAGGGRGFEWLLRWEWLLVLLIILVTIGNALLSPFFLQTANLMRASSDFMELGLMMLPMVFVIISNNIDLSVASTLGMTASFMGWLFNAGWNIWAAAGAGASVGAGCRAFNGLLISRLRLPALVVTLGTYAFYRGMAYALLGDEAACGYPAVFNFLGQGWLFDFRLPFSVVLFAVLALVFGLVLHKTTFGRQVYAIGNNEEAARFAGVPVRRNKLMNPHRLRPDGGAGGPGAGGAPQHSPRHRHRAGTRRNHRHRAGRHQHQRRGAAPCQGPCSRSS